MKKCLLFVLMALAAYRAGAVPPPEGSNLRGDEFCHWSVDETKVPPQTALIEAQVRRAEMQQLLSIQRASGISHGENHFLVLLIEFSDLSFTVSNPNQAFTNLLNQEGYSANGATGSVRDYYVENSGGDFKPTYDVVGPIKLSKSWRYYGGNVNGSDAHPDEALHEACGLIDSQIDFSVYDHDKDGMVDNIFFFYAGHNEAEGGPADSIWPHAWSLFRYTTRYDGVRPYSYACTSEYRGTSGNTMCGIGTFCHEFGHVLGLPDFYDTDYEQNGQASHLYTFSLMASGSYNNNGRTPPYLGSIERNILGWHDLPTRLLSSGRKTLKSVQENESYMVEANREGEFFVFETRGGKKWDAYIPQGMIVYHMDKSTRSVGGTTARNLWTNGSNKINAYGSHPCFYLIVAQEPRASDNRNLPFPGSANVTSYTPVDWDGMKTIYDISGITYTNGVTNFTFYASVSTSVAGYIRNEEGSPLKGVEVSIRPDAEHPDRPVYSAVTGDSGYYHLIFGDGDFRKSFDLKASRDGYLTSLETISLDIQQALEHDIVLKRDPTIQPGSTNLPAMGYTSIHNPGFGLYQAGTSFKFELVESPSQKVASVAWFFDGKAVTEPSVVLTAGSHTVQAIVTLVSGGKQSLLAELKAE